MRQHKSHPPPIDKQTQATKSSLIAAPRVLTRQPTLSCNTEQQQHTRSVVPLTVGCQRVSLATHTGNSLSLAVTKKHTFAFCVSSDFFLFPSETMT